VRDGSTTGHLGADEAPGDHLECAAIVLGRPIERAPLGPSSRARVEDDRLTICHVFSGDLWAGAEVVIFNLLSCLRQDPSLRVVALALNEGTLTERLRQAGVTTHVIPERRHSLPGVVWRAARLLRAERIGVIHSHRYKENVLAWLLAKRLGVADVVTTVHGLPERPDNRGADAQSAGWRRRLDYLVLRNAFSTIVAVSEEMKHALVARYGFTEDRVRVIRNGGSFPADLVPAASPHEVFHIGTVGRMVPIKGLDLFLRVAATLRRETSAVRFSILGDGPLHGELGRQAADLKIEDCVEFVTPRPDPFGYYGSLDLYLNTSLHEGLPLSVVEAMACGKPVVSAAVGGIPEIVADGEDGFLVSGRDPERFAERCRRLMRDVPRWRAMSRHAAASAHTRLSAETMARAYRRLYEEGAARHRGAPLGGAATRSLPPANGERR
jgi:L-malate glycosyltransferase